MAHHSEEFNTFTKAVEQIMAVPKAEILKREAEYRRQADLNPNKRGPKPKIKRRRRASPGPAAEV